MLSNELPNLATEPCRATNLHLTLLHAQLHIIIVVTLLASASESFLISFMLHSPTNIFFIISPSSLSHSQILTPRVRLPSSKLPNSLNWKISKCWNLQFEISTIWIGRFSTIWPRLYQLYPDVNNLDEKQQSNAHHYLILDLFSFTSGFMISALLL